MYVVTKISVKKKNKEEKEDNWVGTTSGCLPPIKLPG